VRFYTGKNSAFFSNVIHFFKTETSAFVPGQNDFFQRSFLLCNINLKT